MKFARMKDEDLKGKTVLIREDLNVPIHDGKITNDARLQSSLPSIQLALDKGAAVIVCSHLGRPTEGQYEEQYSMLPIAHYLSEKLGQQVELCTDYLSSPIDISTGSVVLLENVRFNKGEKANSEALSQQYANLCDVFVMDAFGTAHRAQASTEGVICAAANQGKRVCAGPLLTNELEALEKGLNNPQKPLVAVVGGSKVSTKLDVLISLAKICDQIIVGGGIANTFIAAKGHSVGASLYEADMIDTAKKIMNETDILLPKHVLVANKEEIDFSDFIGSLSAATPQQKPISEVGQDDMILDIASEGSEHIMAAIKNASTILWNGPLGVFEVDGFSGGTQELAKAIEASNAFSIAGGGDTLSAIHKFNVENGVSYMSTGGGAFLEFVEGKTLPAVAALTNNC